MSVVDRTHPDELARFKAMLLPIFQLDDAPTAKEMMTVIFAATGTVSVFDELTVTVTETYDAWALRTLAEVHRLASAYGWREQDILALSPARRQLYLGMVGP